MPKLLTRCHTAIQSHSADLFFSVTSPEKMEKMKMAKLPATRPATAPVAAATPAQAPVAAPTVATAAIPPATVPGAPVAPATGQVAETGDEEAEEKERRKLPPHPELWDSAANEGKGAPLKLKEVPADFDPRKHKPLAKKNFIDEAVFYDYAAKRALEKAAMYEEKAKQSRLLGATADKASMKKFVAMQARIAELQKQILDATPPEMREAVQAQMNAQLAAMKQPTESTAGVPAVAGSDE